MNTHTNNNTDIEILPAGSAPGPVEMALIPRTNGLERFKPLQAALAEKKQEALDLSISAKDSPAVQKSKMETARRLRLDVFKATRVTAKKVHTELKADVLEIGRALDAAERTIRQECEGIEAHLEEVEKFAERERQRIEDETRNARTAEISPFLAGPLAVDLGKVTEEQYQQQLADAKELHTLRLDRERKAAEEAAAKAKAEEEERQRLAIEAEERRKEIERMRAEAAAKEAERLAELDRLKKEQAARDAAARREREEVEARAAAELAALAEKNRLEREAREAEEAAERAKLAEAARREREAAAALAAEKAAREAEEARQRKEAEEAARRAAAAPDVEKIKALAEALRGLSMPTLANANVQNILIEKRDAFVAWVLKQAAALEGGQQ